ncbi:hypothetical protein [Comamonas testosteroni]|uniref:hypothetical protein n=1 Tax=Comamonas testosteroni TaxID=285 RepID=UPI00391B0046
MRISANKLAELLITPNPVRRRRIVHDQKYPSDAVVPLYRHAHAPIDGYFRNGRNRESLIAAANTLRENREGSEWAIDDRWNTADALELFADIAEGLPSDDGITYTKGENSAPKLNISGVDVSVRPDFILNFTKRGVRYTGALKLHFIKNPDNALNRQGSEYVSTLLYRWLEENAPDGVKPSHAHCLSVDVFRQTTLQAPRSNMRRMQEIAAACEDIAFRWPHL